MSAATEHPTAFQSFTSVDRTTACIRLTGDIDITSEQALSALAVRLADFRKVNLDMAGVTFAGSTLLHFLVAAVETMPAGSSLVVCRPSRMTRRLIEMTSVKAITSVRGDLPLDWTVPGRAVPPARRRLGNSALSALPLRAALPPVPQV